MIRARLLLAFILGIGLSSIFWINYIRSLNVDPTTHKLLEPINNNSNIFYPTTNKSNTLNQSTTSHKSNVLDPTTKPIVEWDSSEQTPAEPTILVQKPTSLPKESNTTKQSTSSSDPSKHQVDSVSSESPKMDEEALPIPIGIITSRPALLNRLFEYTTTLATRIDPANIFVLEDGTSDETSQIIAKYNVTRVTCPNQIRGLKGLNQNYRCLMEFLYTNTPAGAYIFVEEDLMLAPDFYSFFSQLVPVMMKDPSIFCISTWFDNGYELYSQNASIVIRQEHFGGYGWAITRKFYESEIRPTTWQDSNARMWDQYMQDLTRDRVCLAPEVARTHHASGNTGATINQISQSSNFDNIRLSTEKHVDLPTQQLTARAYDNMTADIIRDGIFIKCKGELLDYQHKILLIYFLAGSANDNNWNAAVSWFGMWGTGNGGAQRGVSRGMISFQYALNRVFLIASYSPIIQLIPEKFKGVEPHQMQNADWGGSFGSHECRKLPLYVPNDMKIEASANTVGRSCAEVCEEKGKTCKLNYLPFVNYCDKLKEITSCTSCTDLPGNQPSLAIPFVDGQRCVFSHNEKWLNCRGVPKDNEYRVCPCV